MKVSSLLKLSICKRARVLFTSFATNTNEPNSLFFVLLVLNDPHKRAIYDCLGKEGLQEQGWEIVQRTKTPQEIREEYDRLAR